jgi:hypothetical protein
MNISYAITVCNEFVEIQRLVSFLLQHKRIQDNIVILYDEANGDPEIESYLRSHSINGEFSWHKGKFERHFADWKNKLTSLCSGDYIFFLDADEIPSEDLIQTLPEMLEINPEMDTFLVPRINTVDGITSEHIASWGWNVTKLDSVIGEKILDLSNPKDLKEYEFLKECDFIIEEN